ncbi:MAG: FixH family protein [Planctomycetota bacterium]
MSPSRMAFLGAVLALVGCRAPGDGSAPDAASTADPPAGSPLPGEPDAHAFAFDTPRELVTRDGAYVVTWQPTEDSIPINDHFEVDVTLARNDERRAPVTGADVIMTCYMPDHGHGMLREPRSEELGDGRYRVRGFLLHMDGFWTVSISLVVDGVASTADDELRL